MVSLGDTIYRWKNDDFLSTPYTLVEQNNEGYVLRRQGEIRTILPEWTLPDTTKMNETDFIKTGWFISLGRGTTDVWRDIRYITTKEIYDSHAEIIHKNNSTSRSLYEEFSVDKDKILRQLKQQTLHPKLHSFILRVYNGILIWWLWRNPTCHHCEQPETWKHILFECERAKHIRSILGIQCNMSEQITCNKI